MISYFWEGSFVVKEWIQRVEPTQGLVLSFFWEGSFVVKEWIQRVEPTQGLVMSYFWEGLVHRQGVDSAC